jgi:pyruvate dehydrogenase E2 component (dihydrolipoamide acetyltransferase)
MAMDFCLPDIGEGVVEGEVVRWLVAEGDSVREDQPTVEIMTDKATVEITSPVDGRVLSLPWNEGDVVPVDDVLIVFEVEGNGAPTQVASEAPEKSSPSIPSTPTPTPTPTPTASSGGKVLATPATRHLARQLGVDLSQVPATGKRGRITREDVESFRSGGAIGRPTGRTPGVEVEERVPLKGLRRAIADAMVKSVYTAPHFTYVDEIDMSAMVRLRQSVKPMAAEKGVKINYLPFIIKATLRALEEFPMMNASLDESSGEIVLKKYYHIGFACATPRGLVVPVIRDADTKGLFQIASEMGSLAEKARTGKASRDELTGSTFTVTSTGNVGGMMATPIINHPEVAIMGVHVIKERPVVRDGQIVIGHLMNLSLSFDHRVIDGEVGARFTNRIKEFLEEPALLFLHDAI